MQIVTIKGIGGCWNLDVWHFYGPPNESIHGIQCSTEANEFYLWHGTHIRAALSIAHEEFQLLKSFVTREAEVSCGGIFLES